MQTKDLFSHSKIYAQSRPTYPPELYSYLASLVTEKERAWDCACGNGQATIALAPYFEEVIGTDINQHQLDEVQAAPNVIYSRCPAEETPFPHHYFSLITVAQALHWMDYERFWLEVLRVLRPGGIFATWGYSFIRHTPEIQAVIDEYILALLRDLWHPRNQILWSGFKKVDFPFAELPAPAFSIRREWTLAQFIDYVRSWSAAQMYIKDKGDSFLKLAEKKLAPVWGQPVQPLHWDLVIRIGRKS